MEIADYIRPYFLKLQAYQSFREMKDAQAMILMDGEENPYAILEDTKLNRRPDFAQTDCKTKLAAHQHLSADELFLANTKDEIIDLLTRVTCEPGKDNVLVFPPSDFRYQQYAEQQGVYVQLSTLSETYELDLDTAFNAINSATKLMFISNPNLITGKSLDREDIMQLVKGFPHKLVVVDETLIEFSKEKSLLPEIQKYPNLIILSDFGVATGLSGLNVAVAYAHPEIIEVLNKTKYPFNLNTLTLNTFSKALDHIVDVKLNIQKVLKERDELVEKLKKLKITELLIESDSNLILARFKKPQQLHAFLFENGILVKDYSHSVFTRNCLRITVGSPEENWKLIEKIKEFEHQTYIQ